MLGVVLVAVACGRVTRDGQEAGPVPGDAGLADVSPIAASYQRERRGIRPGPGSLAVTASSPGRDHGRIHVLDWRAPPRVGNEGRRAIRSVSRELDGAGRRSRAVHRIPTVGDLGG